MFTTRNQWPMSDAGIYTMLPAVMEFFLRRDAQCAFGPPAERCLKSDADLNSPVSQLTHFDSDQTFVEVPSPRAHVRSSDVGSSFFVADDLSVEPPEGGRLPVRQRPVSLAITVRPNSLLGVGCKGSARRFTSAVLNL
jgi:hypothetical protein